MPLVNDVRAKLNSTKRRLLCAKLRCAMRMLRIIPYRIL